MPGWRSTGVLGQCRLAQQGYYGPGVRVVYGWYTGGTGGTGVQEWRDRADREMACQLEVAQQN